MNHHDVFKKFNEIFNLGSIEQWWQNGFNSVRIRFEDKKEVVFTYTNDGKWTLETIYSYIQRMNKIKKGE
jgi:hypothetical protein